MSRYLPGVVGLCVCRNLCFFSVLMFHNFAVIETLHNYDLRHSRYEYRSIKLLYIALKSMLNNYRVFEVRLIEC